jgi:glycosyltransferase involved in cell wall biosynthesis
MRIGVYNTRVGTAASGGTETFLREVMKRLARRHEVVCYTGAGELLDGVAAMDVTVRQLPYLSKESAWSQRLTAATPLLPAELESLTMYRHARREGVFEDEVDVLSLHYFLDNLLVSRSTDLPTVFHFPGIRQPSWRWRLMARGARPTLSLGNSRSTAERAARWLDIETDGIVYPGVDVEQFAPDVEPTEERDAPVVLYVGRLDEGKGLGELLRAHARLDDAELWLVGDGRLEADLRRTTDRLGTADRVRFIGAVPHEEVHRWYAAADAFCLPSHHESLGIVNLEAMATGVPVVSTRIDAIEEYLVDGENGLLVGSGDIEGLTAALERLVGSPELRERFAEAGRETALEFSWDEQTRRLEEFYAQAID